jgi:hypothetical protein
MRDYLELVKGLRALQQVGGNLFGLELAGLRCLQRTIAIRFSGGQTRAQLTTIGIDLQMCGGGSLQLGGQLNTQRTLSVGVRCQLG